MRTTHWVTIAMFAGSLSLLLASLHSWSEATSPQFLAGVIGAIATTLKATFDDKPERKD
jgi:hypothetical protein